MKKKIISMVLSVVLVLLAVFLLKNEKVVEAADDLVLLEKRHPGYWEYLRNNAVREDLDGDEKDDITIYPFSKMYKEDVTSNDYKIFLKDAGRDNDRRVVYFYDGTGIDVDKNIYGTVDTSSWTIINGQAVEWDLIEYIDKPINEITDIYEYLDKLKNYSFIISVKDDAEGAWNSLLQALLENCGLKGGFGFRDSYIAVVREEKVITEKISHATLEYSNNYLFVRSAGGDNDISNSMIMINGKDYSINGRGLNIVVLDNGKIIDSVVFDTFGKYLICSR